MCDPWSELRKVQNIIVSLKLQERNEFRGIARSAILSSSSKSGFYMKRGEEVKIIKTLVRVEACKVMATPLSST